MLLSMDILLAIDLMMHAFIVLASFFFPEMGSSFFLALALVLARVLVCLIC